MPRKSRQRATNLKRPKPTKPAASRKWLQTAAVCLALAVVTLFAFRNVRNNDFVQYDDDFNIQNNPQLHQGFTPQSIHWAFTTFFSANWHPLTWLTHMADWSLYGDDPGPQHLTSVYLHAANSILLFLALFYMTSLRGRSAVVAFLFALHPAHVESVAWLAERKEILCALFWFATLLAYAWYVRRPSWNRYASVILFYACALMSKPMSVTLPFTLLLLDLWPLRRIPFTSESRPNWFSTLLKLCLEKLPLFLMAAASSAVTFLAQRSGGAVNTLSIMPLWIRLSNAAISYCRYLRILFWPNPLIAYYLHANRHTSIWAAACCALTLLLITAPCIYFCKSKPYCLMGWLWFLGTFVPVIGIVQVGDQAMAERYTYVPFVGPFIALVWLAADTASKSPKLKLAAQLLAVAILAACAIKTSAQVNIWKDTVSLFSHVVQVDPRGEDPNLILGVAYAKAGNTAEAKKYLQTALTYNFNSYMTHNNLGTLYFNLGQMSEAMQEFRYSLAIFPAQPMPHYKIGWILAHSNQLPQAAIELTQSLQLDPTNADAHNDLGVVFYQLGDFEKSAEQFSSAAQLEPSNANTRKNLALAQSHIKSKSLQYARK
jgi:protein O-mannosyl-transferase